MDDLGFSCCGAVVDLRVVKIGLFFVCLFFDAVVLLYDMRL